MKDPDEKIEETTIDIENVVRHLFAAYPNANYIALNTGLSYSNEGEWKDRWYFVGFDDKPIYKNMEGKGAWVYDKSVDFGDQEWGLFFLHISSKFHCFRGVPIQKDPYDYASPRFFCWERPDDKGNMVQIISTEVEIPDETEQIADNINDMVTELTVKTALNRLEN